MIVTPWLPTVRRIKDGETVDQATVNVPIDQLTQREQHLYEKFESLLGKSVLISFDQPIYPGETLDKDELNIVYFKSHENQSGISKAITGFSSSSTSSMFSPNKSNYAFGIVKTIYSAEKTADIFTEGLCEFEVDIDDPVLGLIQKDGTNVEPFEVGPYYLSRKTPGKITKDPAGIPVYIGYALSKRRFLLHANVDEFSQFFINYRYHALDRVAGIPSNSGGTWTIATPDTDKLGWVPVSAVSSIVAPAGAVFYYNIPSIAILSDPTAPNYDAALAAFEREEALDLKKFLPPVPSNFIQLSIDGIIQRYKDAYDVGGIYSVNEYGLWWHSSSTVPWSSSYPNQAPSDWAAIKTTLGDDRPNVFISFSKFNPALRTQLVSSLAPFNTVADQSTNFIKFYSKDNPSQIAATGDLLVKILAPFYPVGFSAPTFTFPTGTASTYTANRAIAALEYTPALGGFKTAITPVVAKVVGNAPIQATESPTGSGIWNISYLSDGITGFVDSIEPINARLEFRGLTSFLKLPPPTSTPYGLIGKIVLPKGYLNNKKLMLKLNLFGDTVYGASAEARNIALQMEYSAVTSADSAAFSQVPNHNQIVSPVAYTPTINPIEMPLTVEGSGYTQYEVRTLVETNLSVPADFVYEDSVVNFKLMRVATSDTANSYVGNIGLISIYWEIVNA